MKNIYNSYVRLKLTLRLILAILASGSLSAVTNAQVIKPFMQRTSSYSPSKKIYNIKGDYTMIGNTNLTLNNYADNIDNNSNIMVYVDVDGDANTLNSSSSTLALSNENGANPSCSNIVYAGLYWTGRTDNETSPLTFTVTKNSVTKNYNKQIVSIKGPGAVAYTTVMAAANDIYYPSTTDNYMYSAYAEVTDYVKTHGIGNYTIADIALREGNGGSAGYYGGWGLVVIYENPKMNLRDITLYDGHAYVQGSATLNHELPISGFNTVQSGNVNMKLGMMAGEGDGAIGGDYLQIIDQSNNWVSLNHTGNTANNFFNSSIQTGGNVRNPDLKNNTGLDISMFDIPNTNNSIITNNQTSTRFKYGSTQDSYIIFCLAMAVDAYIPNPEGLSKIQTINGLPPSGSPLVVKPDENIVYRIELRNKGTEAINNTRIVIPIPYTANYVNSSKKIYFTPSPSPNNLYFDPLLGANGSVIWDFGTLPISADLNTLLADLTITIKASTDCGILANTSCSPKISVNGSFSGTGTISGANFSDFSFISGYRDSGSCQGDPITDPVAIFFDASQYVSDNCPVGFPIRSYTYCNPGTSIPITNVSGNFPVGSKFYNSYPVTSLSVEYTINNPFPATPGTTNYYSIPPGEDICFFEFTISVSNVTSVPAVNDVSYCQNEMASPLEATASDSKYTLYYFTDLVGGIPQKSIIPLTTNAGAITYYVAEGYSEQCFSPNRVPIVVTINPSSAVVTHSLEAICSPATVDLTLESVTEGSTPGLIFTYWNDSLATSAFETPTLAGEGIYYIKGATSEGCFDIKPVSVTFNPTPTVVTHNPEAVCSPATVNLTLESVTEGSTPGLTFTYWTDATATSAFETPTAAGEGIYYIKGTKTAGCFDIKPVSVTVNPTPTVVIHSPEAVCSSSTIDLTLESVTEGSTPGLTFTYWTDAVATSAFETPTSAGEGIYYIKGTTTAGCFDIKSVSVTINPTPTVVTHNPEAVCSPATVNLTLESVTEGSTSGLIFTYWNDSAATSALETPATVVDGIYYIKGSTAAGCFDIKPVVVTVNLPVTANAGLDQPLCSAIPFQLSEATAANYSSLQWTHNGQGNLSDASILNPTYTPAVGETGAIEFTLTAKGAASCGNPEVTDKIILTIYPALIADAGADKKIDQGTATTLSGTANGGSKVLSFTWLPSDLLVSNDTLNPTTLPLSNETVFTLTVLDAISGCSVSDDVKISMIDNSTRPIARDDYAIVAITIPQKITILENDSDPIGLGLTVSIIANPLKGSVTLNSDNTITYTAAKESTGSDTLTYQICDKGSPSKCGTARVIITISPVREPFEVYNLVTPNGDGQNDYWYIGGINEYIDNEVILFNRWGDKVSEFKNYNNDTNRWNGTNKKGEFLPDGVYFYIIKVKELGDFKGWVYVRGNGNS